jgi:nodulation protein A
VAELLWSVAWETDLDDAEHEPVASLLARAYPTEAHRLVGGRSWTGARPELRVVGRAAGEPVAHAGVIRRFLRAGPGGGGPGADVLVGHVGLVAVDPARHGSGLGRALMTQVVATLVGLDVPFGFLTCGPDVEGFYRAAGWTRLPDIAVRMVTIDDRTLTAHDPAMVHPAGRHLADWPAADVLAQDGRGL